MSGETAGAVVIPLFRQVKKSGFEKRFSKYITENTRLSKRESEWINQITYHNENKRLATCMLSEDGTREAIEFFIRLADKNSGPDMLYEKFKMPYLEAQLFAIKVSGAIGNESFGNPGILSKIGILEAILDQNKDGKYTEFDGETHSEKKHYRALRQAIWHYRHFIEKSEENDLAYLELDKIAKDWGFAGYRQSDEPSDGTPLYYSSAYPILFGAQETMETFKFLIENSKTFAALAFNGRFAQINAYANESAKNMDDFDPIRANEKWVARLAGEIEGSEGRFSAEKRLGQSTARVIACSLFLSVLFKDAKNSDGRISYLTGDFDSEFNFLANESKSNVKEEFNRIVAFLSMAPLVDTEN